VSSVIDQFNSEISTAAKATNGKLCGEKLEPIKRIRAPATRILAKAAAKNGAESGG
jgi:hypothetical protein